MRRHAHGARDRRISALGRQLVDECESFLEGRYPTILQAEGLVVPDWAWLSMLAHAPMESLAARAAGVHSRRGADRLNVLWEGALSLLSQELFLMAERTGTPVEDLQHTLVTEVELNPGRTPSTSPTLGPSHLVEEVREALGRRRDSWRP